jgi:putative flavoprotein involved in K+ transport
MTVEKVDTLVVGGGQAGLAASEHLSNNKVPHLIVERNRIAERWRSERWDSLVANGPAWHDRFPTMEFAGLDPDSFAPRDRIVDYFEAFAEQIAAPVRCGVEVTSLTRLADGSGFRAETSQGVIEAKNVIAATGPFQKPIIPVLVPAETAILQIHSAAYRNPQQLPAGAVMVIGAGSSGTQIADELARSGRKVYLSVGPHNRPPRAYRGRDFVWWLGALGHWNVKTYDPALEHVTIAVSGARGGHTVDFRKLADAGITLVGRAEAYQDGVMRFAPDLAKNIAAGDADYLSVLDAADAYAVREGLNLPEEPEARVIGPVPQCVTEPVLELDLEEAGITSIIWATGYALDFGWLKVGDFDAKGRPVHKDGVSPVPGLYFVGLSWLSRRASAFIWGAWGDAKNIAEHIAAHRS